MGSKRQIERRTPGETQGRRVVPTWYAFVALGVLCGLLYGRTVTFGFTRTDDTVQLVDNARFVGSLTNLSAAFTRPFFAANGAANYYRPLVTVTYMVDAQWAATRPAGYHLTNTILHLAAAWLFLVFVRRLGLDPDLSLAAAGVLVVHPLLTSAVAWVPGRGDSLLALWFLSAMLSLQRWLEKGDLRFVFSHAAFMLLALFTKEAATALPLVFAMFLLLVAPEKRALRKPVLWFAWALPLLTWHLCRQKALTNASDSGLLSQLEELARHAKVVLVFLAKAVWPFRLSVLAIERDAPWLAGAIATLPIIFACYWLRGAPRRLFAWGLCSFVVLLLPSLAVSDFLILEIRSYAPLVGLLVGFLAVAQQMRQRWSSRRAILVQRAVAAAVLAVLAVRTNLYLGSFKDADTYTRQAVATSPHSALAHLNRGIVLQLGGHATEADGEYRVALELDPSLPVTHNNLGLLELQRGRADLAERLFREELALNPSYDKAHFNLALALKAQGRLEEAAASLERAVVLNPENEDALEGLMRPWGRPGRRGLGRRARRGRRLGGQRGDAYLCQRRPEGARRPEGKRGGALGAGAGWRRRRRMAGRRCRARCHPRARQRRSPFARRGRGDLRSRSPRARAHAVRRRGGRTG
jgi:tetratricopeptide (TPR) repeat protein